MKQFDIVGIAKCNIMLRNGSLIRAKSQYCGVLDESEFCALEKYFALKSVEEVKDANELDQIVIQDISDDFSYIEPKFIVKDFADEVVEEKPKRQYKKKSVKEAK